MPTEINPGSNNGQNAQTPGNTGLGPANGNTNTLGVPGLQQPTPNQGAVRAFNKLLEEVGVDPKWADLLIDWIRSFPLPSHTGPK